MGYVVTFSGYRPAPRFDSLPWTQAVVSEGAGATGPWVDIATITLTPDADPAHPAARDFTTEDATLEEGWYRVTFVDADGDSSVAPPIWSSSKTDSSRPTVDDVALLLRTRTISGAGFNTGLGGDTYPNELVTFTTTTRPTAAEADRMIQTAYEATLGELTAELGPLPPAMNGMLRHAVALYAAILIETSFFREQATEDDIKTLRDMRNDILRGIRKAMAEPPVTEGNFGFGTLVIGSIREQPSPWEHTDGPLFGVDF
jgi:hypothetical protein